MSSAIETRPTTPAVQPTNSSREPQAPEKPFGPAAAAFLAAGIASAFFGIFTTIVEGSKSLQKAITYSTAVGPLSGKVIWAGVVYVAALTVAGAILWRRNPSPKVVYAVSGVLIAIGLIFTFPPTWALFGA